jgi:hypothetical protein
VNQPKPVIVDITQPPDDPISGLADIFIGALGLTGAMLLAAIVIGVVLGGLIFWLRSRRPPERHQPLDRP